MKLKRGNLEVYIVYIYICAWFSRCGNFGNRFRSPAISTFSVVGGTNVLEFLQPFLVKNNATKQNKISADQYHVTISRAQVYSSSWPLTNCWFSIGTWAYVRFTRWKLGGIVQKSVNAYNPGLKFIRIVTLCFEYMVIIKRKTESQTVNRKLHRKVTKPKSAFYLFLGKLNRALNNPAKELCF